MFSFRSLFMGCSFLIVLSGCVEGQRSETVFTQEHFESVILDYQPPRRKGISEEAYRKGTFFLEQTRAATGHDPEQLNAADFWNITMAFLQVGEPPEHVALAFQKAVDRDPASICGYIEALGSGRLDSLIPSVYIPFYETHCQIERTQVDFDLAAYIQEHKLESGLLELVARISERDRRYRGQRNVAWDKQRPLDLDNQRLIDSLYRLHNTYLGQSLVGPKFQFTMWSVVQHSNLPMMERYLPVIAEATQQGELQDDIPLKMLIDRVYLAQYGYQVFGSQGGPLADDTTREEVKQVYGLD